jgi:hypothetical protein
MEIKLNTTNYLFLAGTSLISYLLYRFRTFNSKTLINSRENHYLLRKDEAFHRSNHLKVNNYTLFLYLPHSSRSKIMIK